MNSRFIGKKLRLEVYGGSHEDFLGFTLQGFPVAEISLDEIIKDIERRKPNYIGSTLRVETDQPIFKHGYNGKTTDGGYIVCHFKNENFKKSDYSHFYNHPRPGHIDFVVRKKYDDPSFVDGSSIFSGRMTLPLVVVGSFCKQLLKFEFVSKIVQIGQLRDLNKIDEYLLELGKKGDSAGGIVEVIVKNVPMGIGGPLFDRLSSRISQAVLSIPGTKGIEFGAGFNCTNLLGSQFNDRIIDQTGLTFTNNNGGLSGGITNGNELVIRVAFRPPASISLPQKTYNFETDQIDELIVKGRHDVSYVRRVPVVVESMIALALLDEQL